MYFATIFCILSDIINEKVFNNFYKNLLYWAANVILSKAKDPQRVAE